MDKALYSILLEITQQSRQPFLVGVVVLPLGEVTNVAHTANIGCPRLMSLHYRLIQLDRKENRLILIVFFLESGVHFFLDPGTLHRMLREDQQKFVMKTNGLINT